MNRIDNFKTFEGKFWDKNTYQRKRNKVLREGDILIKQLLKKYLLNKFSFQYAVYIWKSNHENYEEIDVADFELIDIYLEHQFTWTSDKSVGVFIYLIFVDKDGDKIAVHFIDKTPTEKMGNLEYDIKPWEKNEKTLHGDYMDHPDYEKEDFEGDKIYPRKNGWIDLVPNEYKTTEFLKEVKSILEMLNDQFD